MRGKMSGPLAMVGLMIICGLPGCTAPARLSDAYRYQNGVVFVLPGIEGKSFWNKNIAVGLDEGGVRGAIEVCDWTIGLPGGFVYNLANLQRNRREAEQLSDHILAHRVRYPGTPVTIIGHSAGGAVALLALEALPEGEQVEQVLLLAPAISPDYDLSVALRHTRYGVINFYSHKDVGLLKIGTTVFGSVDRKHGESAGAVGFVSPLGLGKADRYQYATKLRQVRWTSLLKRYGANGSHLGWTTRKFAASYLAPLILKYERRGPQKLPLAVEAPRRDEETNEESALSERDAQSDDEQAPDEYEDSQPGKFQDE